MAILRTSEIRAMSLDERADEIETLRSELVRERALTSFRILSLRLLQRQESGW